MDNHKGEIMLSNYKYTDDEKKKILSSIVYIVDTREKVNDHILNIFDKKGTKYVVKKLDFGDYSFYIPKDEELGIMKDLWFDKEVVIERKASLEELSNNLTKERTRFEEELALGPPNKVLLIENAFYTDVVTGNYNTNFNKKSFLATLHSFWFKYNCPFVFMDDASCSAVFIRWYLSSYFKKKYLR